MAPKISWRDVVFREWRGRKRIMYIIMILELGGVIATLVFFGIAQPDLYRTVLWRVGHENGFNSSPDMILYAYANHRPLPKIPFIWSQELTNFNVAISVLSLFVLLAKLIAFIMKVWLPIIGFVFSFTMMALYTTSVYGQVGPDYADKRHPSPVAWYIRYSCEPARPWGAYHDCQLAKGTFAVTVYMLFLYVVLVGLAVFSLLPHKQKEPQEKDDDDSVPSTKIYEMMPATPKEVFTPRTQAFHTLERKLPLRDRFS